MVRPAPHLPIAQARTTSVRLPGAGLTKTRTTHMAVPKDALPPMSTIAWSHHMAGDARSCLDSRGVVLIKANTPLDARDPPPTTPVESGVTGTSSRDPAQKQVNELHQVQVMRWRGGWAARVPTPSLYTPLTPAPRNPINLWQAAPWRRGAGRYRVLMKLLRLATRRRAVLGATFLDSDDSKGHLNPQTWLSGDVHASA